MKKKVLTIIAIVILSIIAILAVILAAIYLWPLRTNGLQTGTPQTVTYQQSIERFTEVERADDARGVTDECKSKLLTHGQKSAKVVVMLHGVTACSKQFDGLAKTFYDAGYNVYIPTAPDHGTSNRRQHAEVRSQELIDYVNTSITTATGLGDELGVVGLSGGGMLGTWAAEYRPEVKRLLLLSPFYEPDAGQAPKWQLPLLSVLYGFHIAPDMYSPADKEDPESVGLSYRALANYVIVYKNLKKDPSNLSLKSIALVTSDDDDQIDIGLARSVPTTIADSNGLSLINTQLPADWSVGHDIVSLSNKDVAARQQQLFKLYFDSYENRPSQL